MRKGVDYVIVGKWIDKNWHDLAKRTDLSPEEVLLLLHGPRLHPFWYDAVVEKVGADEYAFASRQARDRFHHERDHDAA